MPTARSLIRGALTDLGVASSEEPIQASMAEDALALLNMLLESWATESVLVYYTPATVIPWPAGTPSLTWGVGGAIASARPLRLQPYASYRSGPDMDLPLEVLARQEDYAQLTLKAMTSAEPQALYYAPEVPLGTLYQWPVASQGHDVTVYPWQPFTAFAALDADVPLPPGYARALRLALGIECAPQYGVTPGPTRERLAWEAKNSLYPLNAQVGRLRMPAGAGLVMDHVSRFKAGG